MKNHNGISFKQLSEKRHYFSYLLSATLIIKAILRIRYIPEVAVSASFRGHRPDERGGIPPSPEFFSGAKTKNFIEKK